MPTALDEPANRAASLRAQSASFSEFCLAQPPPKGRARELWMQHAAGFILFEKVRAAGLATVDPDADDRVRGAVELAVDATMYALMMQIDGVSGGLRGEDHEVTLAFGVRLAEGDSAVTELDLSRGDGMCMGFHSWIDGDFGDTPVVTE